MVLCGLHPGGKRTVFTYQVQISYPFNQPKIKNLAEEGEEWPQGRSRWGVYWHVLYATVPVLYVAVDFLSDLRNGWSLLVISLFLHQCAREPVVTVSILLFMLWWQTCGSPCVLLRTRRQRQCPQVPKVVSALWFSTLPFPQDLHTPSSDLASFNLGISAWSDFRHLKSPVRHSQIICSDASIL